MRFYPTQHTFYCGVNLHAKTIYVCILDDTGEIRLHRNLPCRPDAFLQAIEPFRENLVVGVECLFCWYWLADLCAAEGRVTANDFLQRARWLQLPPPGGSGTSARLTTGGLIGVGRPPRLTPR